MRLHFSVGCYDRRWTSRRRHGKSFLLIICIDAPESTTNSRSSSLRVDAGKHQFSEGEKNVALSCSLNFNTFLVSFHSASRATLLLPLCLLLRTDPQILERWGCAAEVHLGKYIRAKDFGLECMRDVQWPST